jgi:hypothetical protein
MKSVLRRIVSAVRVSMGWGDLATERLSPEHGWLLPKPGWLRERRELVPVPVVAAPVDRTGRRS